MTSMLGGDFLEPIYSVGISTEFGKKYIDVFCSDITLFDKQIDILTTSAFVGSYHPSPKTLFKALHDIGISVSKLAHKPFIDLRKSCNTWLSKENSDPQQNIGRIGCVELVDLKTYLFDDCAVEQSMINSIRAYFGMLDIAAIYGAKMKTVALPLLGSGNQNLDTNLIIVPLLNECVSFLKRNSEAERIYFIERSPQKAAFIAEYIQQSHTIAALQAQTNAPSPSKAKATAFISYSSKDKNIADNLCFKLEQKGIAVWYAPRDVKGAYAEAITQAIDRSTHFIVILSQNSSSSQHVLNEIDLAFQNLPNNIKFKPLRIDNALFTPSFKYYLSRQHWMDATVPPLEERLNEFVEALLFDT